MSVMPSDAHARMALALIDLARSTPSAPYVAHRLVEHVAAAGLWRELADEPLLLDHLDPDAVASAALRTAFGRADLPGRIAVSLSARHLFLKVSPESRHMTRDIAVACGEMSDLDTGRAWARLWRYEPAHVVLVGHRSPVRAMAAVDSGDGPRVLTAGDDGTIRVWDPTTGRPAAPPLASSGPPVRALVAVPMGRGYGLVAAVGDEIRLWDLTTGKLVDAIAVPPADPIGTLVGLPHPTITLVAARLADGRVRVWDLRGDRIGERPRPQAIGRVRHVSALSLATGGTSLVVTRYDGRVEGWRPDDLDGSGPCLWSMDAAARRADVMASRRGSELLVQRLDGRVVLVAIAATPPNERLVLSPGVFASETVLDCAAIPSSDSELARSQSPLIAFAMDSGVVQIGNVDEPSAAACLAGHQGAVRAVVPVVLSDSRTLMATGGDDGTVRLWQIRPVQQESARNPLAETPRGGGQVTVVTVAFLDGRDLLVSGDDCGEIRVRDLASGEEVMDPMWDQGAIHTLTTVRLSDGGMLLAAAGASRLITLWDLRRGTRFRDRLHGHRATVLALTTLRSADGVMRLISASDDGVIRRWEPTTGQALNSPPRQHAGPIRCLARIPPTVSPEVGHATGEHVASAGRDGRLRWWRETDAGLVAVRDAIVGTPIDALAVIDSATGPLLAAGGSQGLIGLWSGAQSEALQLPEQADAAGVVGLAQLPTANSATLLAGACADGMVRLWNLDSRRLLRTLPLPLDQRPHTIAATNAYLALGSKRGIVACRWDDPLIAKLGLR